MESEKESKRGRFDLVVDEEAKDGHGSCGWFFKKKG